MLPSEFIHLNGQHFPFYHVLPASSLAFICVNTEKNSEEFERASARKKEREKVKHMRDLQSAVVLVLFDHFVHNKYGQINQSMNNNLVDSVTHDQISTYIYVVAAVIDDV